MRFRRAVVPSCHRAVVIVTIASSRHRAFVIVIGLIVSES